MRWIPLAILTAAFALGSPALGDDLHPEDEPRAAHARTDRNDDGFVDREEFHHRVVEVFYLNDANRDGYLSAEEHAKTRIVVLADSDANGDGRAALYEFVDAAFAAFVLSDLDGDGRLSEAEVIATYPE